MHDVSTRNKLQIDSFKIMRFKVPTYTIGRSCMDDNFHNTHKILLVILLINKIVCAISTAVYRLHKTRG